MRQLQKLHSGRVGLELAAALGVLLDRPQRGLAILEEVTDEMVCRAEETVAAGRVTVKYGETPRSAICPRRGAGGGG